MKRILILIGGILAATLTLSAAQYKASSSEIRWVGRCLMSDEGTVEFDWSGTYATLVFEGSRLDMVVDDSGKNYFNVVADGVESIITTEGKGRRVVLFDGCNGIHTLTLQRRTEGFNGRTRVCSFETEGQLMPQPAVRRRHIEFIGDSLTCGYGTDSESKDEPYTPETQNCNNAYACRVADYFDADYNLVAHSGIGVTHNYGDGKRVSDYSMRHKLGKLFDEGEDNTEWSYSDSPYKPDLVVIFLGANDFSVKPFPTYKEFAKGYNEIIAQLRNAYGPTTPILCVAPYEFDPGFDFVWRVSHSGGNNLHFACVLPEYCNNSDELGASLHPNKIGQLKMSMLLIPYISTVTGWSVKGRL